MRFLLAVALLVVIFGVTWKALGHQLPIIEYPLGPFGAPLVHPQIEIHPPGYNVNLP